MSVKDTWHDIKKGLAIGASVLISVLSTPKAEAQIRSQNTDNVKDPKQSEKVKEINNVMSESNDILNVKNTIAFNKYVNEILSRGYIKTETGKNGDVVIKDKDRGWISVTNYKDGSVKLEVVEGYGDSDRLCNITRTPDGSFLDHKFDPISPSEVAKQLDFVDEGIKQADAHYIGKVGADKNYDRTNSELNKSYESFNASTYYVSANDLTPGGR